MWKYIFLVKVLCLQYFTKARFWIYQFYVSVFRKSSVQRPRFIRYSSTFTYPLGLVLTIYILQSKALSRSHGVNLFWNSSSFATSDPRANFGRCIESVWSILVVRRPTSCRVTNNDSRMAKSLVPHNT